MILTLKINSLHKAVETVGVAKIDIATANAQTTSPSEVMKTDTESDNKK